MSVNVNMKKVVVVIILIAVIAGGVWWYVDGAPQRKAEAEIKTMIKFAQRQALEIAIIEQSSKLADYRQQLAKMQQAQPIVPTPPMPAPFVPAVVPSVTELPVAENDAE